MALVLFLHTPVYIAYVCTFASSICIMLFAALFNIYAQTLLQKSAPNQLLGKVIPMVIIVVMCSYPIDQFLYGILLETFVTRVNPLILFACIASLIISLLSKNTSKTTGNDCEKEAVLIQ